jgi:hypothetical protein
MSTFRYHPDLLARYPSLVSGVILAHGMTNQPTTPELLHSYQAEQEAIKRRIGNTPLSELPSLAAWRRRHAFSAFVSTILDASNQVITDEEDRRD